MKTWVVFYDNMHIREGYEERVKEAQQDWAARPKLKAEWTADAARLRALVSGIMRQVALLTTRREI